MTPADTRRALHIRGAPPSEQSLPHILGNADFTRYKNAQQRLAALGLTPDWQWSGQADGWAVAYKGGCTLLLARTPLTATVAIGNSLYETLKKAGTLPQSIQKLLDTAPIQGGRRVAALKLDTGTGLSQLVTLVEAKLKEGG